MRRPFQKVWTLRFPVTPYVWSTSSCERPSRRLDEGLVSDTCEPGVAVNSSSRRLERVLSANVIVLIGPTCVASIGNIPNMDFMGKCRYDAVYSRMFSGRAG